MTTMTAAQDLDSSYNSVHGFSVSRIFGRPLLVYFFEPELLFVSSGRSRLINFSGSGCMQQTRMGLEMWWPWKKNH